AVLDVAEPHASHQLGKRFGDGEAADARRKVGVRGAALEQLPEQRHDPVEPDAVERRQEPRRRGDLEDAEPPAGTSTRVSSTRPRSRSATLRTPKPIVAASNEPSSKGSASRSPSTHVTALDLRLARSSIRGEKSSPVTFPPSRAQATAR